MAGLLTARIYGSNTNLRTDGITTKYPIITDITALADMVYFDIEVLGLYGGAELESETKKLWNGGELTVNKARIKFQPNSIPIDYPDTATTFDGLYGLNVINKRYKWIDIKNYPIRPIGLTATQAIAINITDYSISDNGDGTKSLAFTIIERG